ncbi:MAG TPA: [FeFe] hydrogenase, group A, partial [bacterium]|nr:[FeFe] hydrogenase, group A [bacterium]
MANKDTKKTKKEKEQKSAEKLNLAQCSNAACGAGSGKERKLTGEKIKVTINDKELEVDKGLTILEAARKHNIHIPSLCYHEDLCVAGICRVCVVEIEGERTLKTACTYVVDRPIKIKTSSEKVRKARKFVLELMLANHFGECYSCFRNLNCELQKLAQEYGIDQLRFGHVTTPRYKVDKSSYAVVRDKDKCILCKRCIRTCVDLQEVGVLEAANRGIDTKVQTFFDKPLAEVVCINCGQCINRCPTSALRANDPTEQVWEAIDDPNKIVIIQTAPSPRAAIGELFGLPAGTSVTKKLNTALRMLGFDKVFDTNFTADLTIMEEGTEFLTRVKEVLVNKNKKVKLPMFTSCCPGWVKYAEHFYPEILDNLSTCKSPQQMFGAILKTYYAEKTGVDPAKIVTVALMPCSAKKFECNRPEMKSSGYKDVDYGLTTRELAQMIKEAGINLPELTESDFDHPLGLGSGAGLIFGATGGVMEAALRTVYEIVTGREVPFKNLDIMPVRGMEWIREAVIKFEKVKPEYKFLEGAEVKIAVAHGTANAKKIVDEILAGRGFWHFIEIMACPGGCLGG